MSLPLHQNKKDEFLILGIDPGVAITGFGIIKKMQTSLTLVDCGIFTTPPTDSLPTRLTIIRKDIEHLLALYAPDAACVEKLFFAKNTKTALAVAHARGMLIERIASHHIPIFEYTPLEIKQTVTGFGRAAKDHVARMTVSTLRLSSTPTPDDAVDAIACALCYAFRMNFSSLVH